MPRQRLDRDTIIMSMRVEESVRDSYQFFSTIHGLSASGMMAYLMKEVENVTEPGDVILCVVPKKEKELLEKKLRGRPISEVLSSVAEKDYFAIEDEIPIETGYFTNGDIEDFISACQDRHIDHRFALRRCISALRMRKI